MAKVSYKKIRRVTPDWVDPYGRLTMEDLLDEDQCREAHEQSIYYHIKRGRDVCGPGPRCASCKCKEG